MPSAVSFWLRAALGRLATVAHGTPCRAALFSRPDVPDATTDRNYFLLLSRGYCGYGLAQGRIFPGVAQKPSLSALFLNPSDITYHGEMHLSESFVKIFN